MHSKEDPTGRIPGIDMHFKIDKYLDKIADGFGVVTLENLSRNLCQEFIGAGFFDDDPANYGESVMDVMGHELIHNVVNLLRQYFHTSSISAAIFGAFCSLTLMGEGDCPECGGELRFVETEGHELNDGTYLTPNSYVIDYYIYKCDHCGAYIKSEIEL